MSDDDAVEVEKIKLIQTFRDITIHSSDSSPSCCDADGDNDHSILLLDAGYGFPREKKVRREKINAITNQLSNFLIWQNNGGVHRHQQQVNRQRSTVCVVGCQDENIKTLLENRTIENMNRFSSTTASSITCTIKLPSNVTFTCKALEQWLADHARHDHQQLHPNHDGNCDCDQTVNANRTIYLSPDAKESLDIFLEPPKVVIIGLLIDRRVQPNRSKNRANVIGVTSRRLPLELFFSNIDASEPLNVDCVAELIQQWSWNWNDCCDESNCSNDEESKNRRKETFVRAATQAIEHHAKRHPSRPLHVTKRID